MFSFRWEKFVLFPIYLFEWMHWHANNQFLCLKCNKKNNRKGMETNFLLFFMPNHDTSLRMALCEIFLRFVHIEDLIYWCSWKSLFPIFLLMHAIIIMWWRYTFHSILQLIHSHIMLFIEIFQHFYSLPSHISSPAIHPPRALNTTLFCYWATQYQWHLL